MQLAELVGEWDIDRLEENCSFRLLAEWQEYLIWAARERNGENTKKLQPADIGYALAAATGAKIIKDF